MENTESKMVIFEFNIKGQDSKLTKLNEHDVQVSNTKRRKGNTHDLGPKASTMTVSTGQQSHLRKLVTKTSGATSKLKELKPDIKMPGRETQVGVTHVKAGQVHALQGNRTEFVEDGHDQNFLISSNTAAMRSDQSFNSGQMSPTGARSRRKSSDELDEGETISANCSSVEDWLLWPDENGHRLSYSEKGSSHCSASYTVQSSRPKGGNSIDRSVESKGDERLYYIVSKCVNNEMHKTMKRAIKPGIVKELKKIFSTLCTSPQGDGGFAMFPSTQNRLHNSEFQRAEGHNKDEEVVKQFTCSDCASRVKETLPRGRLETADLEVGDDNIKICAHLLEQAEESRSREPRSCQSEDNISVGTDSPGDLSNRAGIKRVSLGGDEKNSGRSRDVNSGPVRHNREPRVQTDLREKGAVKLECGVQPRQGKTCAHPAQSSSQRSDIQQNSSEAGAVNLVLSASKEDGNSQLKQVREMDEWAEENYALHTVRDLRSLFESGLSKSTSHCDRGVSNDVGKPAKPLLSRYTEVVYNAPHVTVEDPVFALGWDEAEGLMSKHHSGSLSRNEKETHTNDDSFVKIADYRTDSTKHDKGLKRITGRSASATSDTFHPGITASKGNTADSDSMEQVGVDGLKSEAPLGRVNSFEIRNLPSAPTSSRLTVTQGREVSYTEEYLVFESDEEDRGRDISLERARQRLKPIPCKRDVRQDDEDADKTTFYTTALRRAPRCQKTGKEDERINFILRKAPTGGNQGTPSSLNDNFVSHIRLKETSKAHGQTESTEAGERLAVKAPGPANRNVAMTSVSNGDSSYSTALLGDEAERELTVFSPVGNAHAFHSEIPVNQVSGFVGGHQRQEGVYMSDHGGATHIYIDSPHQPEKRGRVPPDSHAGNPNAPAQSANSRSQVREEAVGSDWPPIPLSDSNDPLYNELRPDAGADDKTGSAGRLLDRSMSSSAVTRAAAVNKPVPFQGGSLAEGSGGGYAPVLKGRDTGIRRGGRAPAEVVKGLENPDMKEEDYTSSRRLSDSSADTGGEKSLRVTVVRETPHLELSVAEPHEADDTGTSAAGSRHSVSSVRVGRTDGEAREQFVSSTLVPGAAAASGRHPAVYRVVRMTPSTEQHGQRKQTIYRQVDRRVHEDEIVPLKSERPKPTAQAKAARDAEMVVNEVDPASTPQYRIIRTSASQTLSPPPTKNIIYKELTINRPQVAKSPEEEDHAPFHLPVMSQTKGKAVEDAEENGMEAQSNSHSESPVPQYRITRTITTTNLNDTSEKEYFYKESRKSGEDVTDGRRSVRTPRPNILPVIATPPSREGARVVKESPPKIHRSEAVIYNQKTVQVMDQRSDASTTSLSTPSPMTSDTEDEMSDREQYRTAVDKSEKHVLRSRNSRTLKSSVSLAEQAADSNRQLRAQDSPKIYRTEKIVYLNSAPKTLHVSQKQTSVAELAVDSGTGTEIVSSDGESVEIRETWQEYFKQPVSMSTELYEQNGSDRKIQNVTAEIYEQANHSGSFARNASNGGGHQQPVSSPETVTYTTEIYNFKSPGPTRSGEIYELQNEPELVKTEGKSTIKVVRGNILIKNTIDSHKDDDDFDDNINVFATEFHLDKENPLYQSDPDLFKSFMDESESEEAEMCEEWTEDITFETVNNLARSRTSADKKREIAENRKKDKQKLSRLLLTRLRNLDSRDVKQTINVDHKHEEIYGNIDFIHANGNKSSSDYTENFDSIAENVDLLLKEGKAIIVVKVTAERIIPIDYEFNVWRKSSAVVTRQLEIDLLATEQRKRLYNHVMETAGSRGALEYGGSGGRSRYSSRRDQPKETVLNSRDTFKLFSRLLTVAEADAKDEEGVSETSEPPMALQTTPSVSDFLY